ncbi:metallopeptidase M24 family protein isoform X2 [Wolffia australiana]
MASSTGGGSALTPITVSMELHTHNRRKLLRCLRQRLLDSSRSIHGFVLLQGGEEQNRFCTDHTILFRQESYFAYLFGVKEPGFYGAIDIASGRSILFAPRLPEEYAVWLGKIKPLSHFKEYYMVDMVFYTDEIVRVLHDLCDTPGKPSLFLLYGLNTDSNNYSKPAMLKEMEKFDVDLEVLHPVITECRVHKSDMEIALIQFANDLSSEAHVEVNGKFSKNQLLVYDAVLKAHDYVIASMRPGVNWVDMHKLAERTILEGLKEVGIIHGDIDDMMDRRLGAVFMPHGLGHLLGIDTHDPGGYPKGLERPKEAGLRSLRTARTLEDGMVITVEPGCYFIDALLLPAMEDADKSKYFNHREISRFRGFGGIRIESNVLVTAGGCRNLTNCPRRPHDIEAVMTGAPWPSSPAA